MDPDEIQVISRSPHTHLRTHDDIEVCLPDPEDEVAQQGVHCLYGHHKCDWDVIYQESANVAQLGANK
eukprot:11098574-Prorocentrum_lima.AAC.1